MQLIYNIALTLLALSLLVVAISTQASRVTASSECLSNNSLRKCMHISFVKDKFQVTPSLFVSFPIAIPLGAFALLNALILGV